jgi:hypothetical protein
VASNGFKRVYQTKKQEKMNASQVVSRSSSRATDRTSATTSSIRSQLQSGFSEHKTIVHLRSQRPRRSARVHFSGRFQRGGASCRRASSQPKCSLAAHEASSTRCDRQGRTRWPHAAQRPLAKERLCIRALKAQQTEN